MKLSIFSLAAAYLVLNSVVAVEDKDDSNALRRGLKRGNGRGGGDPAPELPNPCTTTPAFKASLTDSATFNSGFPNPPCGFDPEAGATGVAHECNWFPDQVQYECECTTRKCTEFLDFALNNNRPFFSEQSELCALQGYRLVRLSQWYWQCEWVGVELEP